MSTDAAVLENKPSAPAPAENQSPAPSPSPSSETKTPSVPEKYEFKLDKASPVFPHLETLSAAYKKLGLSQEAAEGALNSTHELVANLTKAAEEKYKAEMEKQDGEWKAASLADKDLGNGDEKTLAQAAEVAKRGLKWADPTGEFQKLVDATGYGFNPAVLRVFKKIGAALQNDKLEIGESTKVQPTTPGDRLRQQPGYEHLKP